MKLEEIIKLENLRQEKSQHRTVHLLKEGNFYHAHDWSAWLMVKFPMCEKPLNVTAKRLKDGYIEAFVGFPCSSIEKYIPNDGSVEFKPASDTMIDVVLLNAKIGEATEEDIRLQVDEWKESLPLQEGKKQRREDREVAEAAPRIVRFSDVIARIVAMPLEDMSPREAWETLRDLRRQVSSLF